MDPAGSAPPVRRTEGRRCLHGGPGPAVGAVAVIAGLRDLAIAIHSELATVLAAATAAPSGSDGP
jgi:hypothetical protein